MISKRCVSTFDHFCPYVNNAMGARNYGYFVYFIVNGLVGNALQLAAALQFAVFVSPYHPWAIVQVPRRPPRPPSSFPSRLASPHLAARRSLQVALFALSTMFAIAMNGYHGMLIKKNLTTNEHMNRHRYAYLRDDVGRYKNAFDGGICANIGDFIARRRNIEADPYVYSERFREYVERGGHHARFEHGHDHHGHSHDDCCHGGKCSKGKVAPSDEKTALRDDESITEEEHSHGHEHGHDHV